jgi:hypothetical protein
MSGRFKFSFNTSVPPRVRQAFWVTIAWAGFSLIAAVALLGYRPYVHDQLIKSNNKSKNPTNPYTDSIVDHDVSRVVWGGLVTSLLGAVILVLLAFLLLRGRGLARWSLIALATVVPIFVPFGIGILIQLVGGLTISGAPLLYRGPVIIAGICSAAVLVLMLLPETSRFFAENRPVKAKRPLFGAGAGGGRARTVRPPLFGRPQAERIPVDVVDVEPSPVADSPPARSKAPKSAPTRPGSVKPKGGGTRPARSKSRNQ